MNRLWAPWRIKFILEHLKSVNCVFCDIPKENKDAENYILHRSNHCFTILNKYPYNSGHLMVIPYQHTNDLTALSDEAMLDMQVCLKRAVQAMKTKLNPQGFNIGMNLGAAGGAGIADHLHYHVVPRWNGDTNFMPVFGETKILPETLEETHQRLISAF